jgi:hypothetical protein
MTWSAHGAHHRHSLGTMTFQPRSRLRRSRPISGKTLRRQCDNFGGFLGRRHDVPSVLQIINSRQHPAMTSSSLSAVSPRSRAARVWDIPAGRKLVADSAQNAARRTHLDRDPRAGVEHRRHQPSEAVERKRAAPLDQPVTTQAAVFGRLIKSTCHRVYWVAEGDPCDAPDPEGEQATTFRSVASATASHFSSAAAFGRNARHD